VLSSAGFGASPLELEADAASSVEGTLEGGWSSVVQVDCRRHTHSGGGLLQELNLAGGELAIGHVKGVKGQLDSVLLLDADGVIRMQIKLDG